MVLSKETRSANGWMISVLLLGFVLVNPVAQGRVLVPPSLNSSWHFIQPVMHNRENKCLVDKKQ